MCNLSYEQRKQRNELYNILIINDKLYNHSKKIKRYIKNNYDVKIINEVKAIIKQERGS